MKNDEMTEFQSDSTWGELDFFVTLQMESAIHKKKRTFDI